MQDQRSVSEQLESLISLAHKNGLYDAADWVRTRIESDKAKLLAAKEAALLAGRKTVSSKESLEIIVAHMNPRQQNLLRTIGTEWRLVHASVNGEDLKHFETLGLIELRELPSRINGIFVTEGRRKA